MRATRWFLFLSYAIGSPAFAIIEAQTGMFSERFGYPPGFLYLVSAAQVVCAFALLLRRAELWSVATLTVLTVGAVVSHVRIESPLTATPALLYTALQVWYGLRVCRPE